MEFCLENLVVYRPSDCIVYLCDEPENYVRLTMSVNRLLLYLLQHRGESVSRDEILCEVWEKYGFAASNNSLNQNVSVLRKTFNTLGITNDVIKTIPKIGFIIPPELLITQLDDAEPGQEFSENQRAVQKFSYDRWLLYGIFIIGVSCIAAAIYLWPSVDEIKATLIGRVGDCKIFRINESRLANDPPSSEQMLAFLSAQNYHCDRGRGIFMHMDSRVENNISGKVFVSSCTYSESKIIACKNTLFNDWRQR